MAVPSQCRFCLEEDTPDNLIVPCTCRGSQLGVHRICLERWRRTDDIHPGADTRCNVCNKNYVFKRKHEDVDLISVAFEVFTFSVISVARIAFSTFFMAWMLFAILKTTGILHLWQTKVLHSQDNFINETITSCLVLLMVLGMRACYLIVKHALQNGETLLATLCCLAGLSTLFIPVGVGFLMNWVISEIERHCDEMNEKISRGRSEIVDLRIDHCEPLC